MNDISSFREKSNLSETRETQSVQQKPSERNPHLVFAMQKHQAMQSQFDLRLEVRGVLKSWALPKGASMNPSDERLAVETENHPQNFQRKNPKGNYGSDRVVVWDKGWYEPIGPGAGPNDRMVRGLRRGAIRFILHGKRLKGGFSLVRVREPDQWLLTKRDDMYALEDVSLDEEHSSISKSRLGGKKK